MAPKRTARPHSKKETKPQPANKNGTNSKSSSGNSFFTWFMVLALLGVWTSVAVVYFDLVDYQGVLGKLVSYDADGDGDFDVEDAKVLLDRSFTRVRKAVGFAKPRDEKPGEVVKRQDKKENPLTKDVGWKLREALKQQLAIIHERVEAKKIAKLALAEVRNILAKEDEEKALGMKREEAAAKAKERVAARMKEEEEKIEKEEMEKAMERLKKEKEGVREEEAAEEEKQQEGMKSKKGGEKEEKKTEKKGGKDGEGEGKKKEKEDKTKSKDTKAAKKSKGDKSDKGGSRK